MNNSTYLKSIFILLFVVLVSMCEGQPSITWQKVFNGPYNGEDGFRSVVGDNMGNSYLLGYAGFQTTFGIYIVKVDPDGDTIWTRFIGGYPLGQAAYSGFCPPDGSLIFTGERDTAFTIHLSADGDILWNKKYPVISGFQPVVLTDMIKTSDNGYIMCGRMFAQTSGCVFKLDSLGNYQWHRIDPGPFQRRYYNVLEVDGGYLIDGAVDLNGFTTNTVFLKINYAGGTIWEKQYFLFGGFSPSTMFKVNDFYWIFGGRGYKISFLKIDTAGIIRDTVDINSPIDNYDIFKDAIEIYTNKYAVTSFRLEPIPGGPEYAEVKIIDSMGVILKSKLFLDYPITEFFGSKREINGDFTFAGFMFYDQINAGKNSNGYAVRTDSNLNYPPVSINNYSDIINKSYVLYQNFPNPFNPETIISFDVPERSNIQILIYNSKGYLIHKLINKIFNTGKYNINWNGTNYPTGIYFVNLIVNGKPTKSIKAILLK